MTHGVGLHIIVVPSHPLSSDVEPLNIDGEWMRLKEIIQKVPYAFSLERTRPPTIEQVVVWSQTNAIASYISWVMVGSERQGQCYP